MDRNEAQALVVRPARGDPPARGGPSLGRAPGLLPTGFAPLDSLLPGGGLPLGRVVELTGSMASGKTTLALMALVG